MEESFSDRVKTKLLSYFTTAALGVYMGCTPLVASLPVDIDIEHGKIIRKKRYDDSDKTLVYIKNQHALSTRRYLVRRARKRLERIKHKISERMYEREEIRLNKLDEETKRDEAKSGLYQVQEDVYNTLKELKEEHGLKLVGREGHEGEHEVKGRSRIKEDYLRRYIPRYPWATVLFEWAYTDDIVTYGLDDDEILNQIKDRIWEETDGLRKIPGMPDDEHFENMAYKKRTDEAVENMIGEMEKRDLDFAAFVYGGGHEHYFIEKLKQINEKDEDKISYIIIEPNSYDQSLESEDD